MMTMNKRYFQGTVKCGFCGKELTAEAICKYTPTYDDNYELYEEQCPYCGYHNTFIEEPYIDPYID